MRAVSSFHAAICQRGTRRRGAGFCASALTGVGKCQFPIQRSHIDGPLMDLAILPGFGAFRTAGECAAYLNHGCK